MLVTQLKVVCCLTTITTSLYLLLYLTMPQDTCRSSPRPGDRILHNYNEISVSQSDSQISTSRNLSVLVRPERRTVVVEPRSDYCQGNTTRTLVIAVFSAPGNSLARAVVR